LKYLIFKKSFISWKKKKKKEWVYSIKWSSACSLPSQSPASHTLHRYLSCMHNLDSNVILVDELTFYKFCILRRWLNMDCICSFLKLKPCFLQFSCLPPLLCYELQLSMDPEWWPYQVFSDIFHKPSWLNVKECCLNQISKFVESVLLRLKILSS